MVETTEIKDIRKKVEIDFLRFNIVFDKNGCQISLDNDKERKEIMYCNVNKRMFNGFSDKKKPLFIALKFFKEDKNLFYPELITEMQRHIIKEHDKYLKVLAEIKERADQESNESKTSQEKEKVIPNENIKTWEDMKKIINQNVLDATKYFLFSFASNVGLWYLDFDDSINDFCWIIFIGVRSSLKSCIIYSFANSEFTYHVDSLTMNTLAPGKAKPSDEDPYSVLDEVKGLNLYIHDLTSFLNMPRKNKVKILGDITNSYGRKPLYKASPGGLKGHGGEYVLTCGLTERLYFLNKTLLDDTGRLLYCHVKKKKRRQVKGYKPNERILNESTLGLLINLRKRFDIEQPRLDIPKDADAYLDDLCDLYEKYVQVEVKWDSNIKDFVYRYISQYDSESAIRKGKQLVILMNAIKFVKDDKTPISKVDVDFVKPLLWGMDNGKVRYNKIQKVIENNKKLLNPNPYELFDCEDYSDLMDFKINNEDSEEEIKEWVNLNDEI